MAKRDQQNLRKISDAINLVNQEVNLLGVVVERREPRRSRGTDWFCSLKIIDETYSRPGLTVNFFTRTVEELPHVKNFEDIILLTRVKIKAFNGEGANAVFNKQISSFALYEGVDGEDFVCYQCSSRFHDKPSYKNSIDGLEKWLNNSKTVKGPSNFSFLREIAEGKCFDLACRILYTSEDRMTFFVWDGTDAPPACIPAMGLEDNTLSSLSLSSFLSRDKLLKFPTVGTILRVSANNRFSHFLKSGEWVKLYGLLCQVDRGSWIGKFTNSTKVKPMRDDDLVLKITRLYDKRISSKLGRMPFWSFPWPPGLTETDYDHVPFVTLMDILTFPKVTYKYKCVVRVVTTYPWQVENFCSDRTGRYRVLLTLEDPTATLKAFLCDEDAEKFFGGHHSMEVMRQKRNRLLGIQEKEDGSENWVVPRNPPWIESCIVSYYTNKKVPWETRRYRIFGTRFLV